MAKFIGDTNDGADYSHVNAGQTISKEVQAEFEAQLTGFYSSLQTLKASTDKANAAKDALLQGVTALEKATALVEGFIGRYMAEHDKPDAPRIDWRTELLGGMSTLLATPADKRTAAIPSIVSGILGKL